MNLTELGIAQALKLPRGPLAKGPIGHRRKAVRPSHDPRRVDGASQVGPVDGHHRFRLQPRRQGPGLTSLEVEQRPPGVWEERAEDFWVWSPPAGETFRAVPARGLTGMERLRAEFPAGTVAVVGHVGTVRVLTSHFLDIPRETIYEMDFPSTGVSTCKLDGDWAHAEVLNDAAQASTFGR